MLKHEFTPLTDLAEKRGKLCNIIALSLRGPGGFCFDHQYSGTRHGTINSLPYRSELDRYHSSDMEALSSALRCLFCWCFDVGAEQICMLCCHWC